MFWRILEGPQEYGATLALQERLHARVLAGELEEGIILFLEHTPVYTLGIRGVESHILMSPAERERRGIALYRTRRGGDVTYHGPGQLVIYPLVDLRRAGFRTVRDFVGYWGVGIATVLERSFALPARYDETRTGIWVGRNKIAAVGLQVKRGVTAHGFALNLDPDPTHFAGIVPCGIVDGGITSIGRERGHAPSMNEVARELVGWLSDRFGTKDIREYNE